jgi:hypothetical protein
MVERDNAIRALGWRCTVAFGFGLQIVMSVLFLASCMTGHLRYSTPPTCDLS